MDQVRNYDVGFCYLASLHLPILQVSSIGRLLQATNHELHLHERGAFSAPRYSQNIQASAFARSTLVCHPGTPQTHVGLEV
jgi:hypothetical protein